VDIFHAWSLHAVVAGCIAREHRPVEYSFSSSPERTNRTKPDLLSNVLPPFQNIRYFRFVK
jgi:hypothetical protein